MTSPDSTPPPLPALLPSRTEYEERLQRILPAALTGSTHTANPAAGATAFTMMYVGAIANVNPIRPSTVLWMSDTIAARTESAERLGYYKAAMKSHGAVEKYCAAENFQRGERWYASDSREQVRDDTLKKWAKYNVLQITSGIDTTASYARYTFNPEFAALFDPSLEGEELQAEIEKWQDKNLDKAGKTRAHAQRKRAKNTATGIQVERPNASPRVLKKGKSNEIIKGVVEEFATKFLADPHVLFISESDDKINPDDQESLEELGMPVDPKVLLVDCIIADVDPTHGTFWFIEVVATDGPVHDQRKEAILKWAADSEIAEDKCRFLTAFASRNASTAKTCLPQLAYGSFAWFLDEPSGLLEWRDSSTSNAE
nr:BsuBI/PstI family type II restriction endonuclease [Kitasatospora mediocidica]